MRFLFLNQYFPPDPAPTGMLMAEIAGRLVERGHGVEMIGARADYRSGPKRGGGRLAREMAGLWQIVRAGLAARRADLVFAGSSPPCLAAAAAFVARRHGARFAHWAMDLYPELAVALGELPEGPVARGIGRLMRGAYRRAALLVAVGEDMRGRFEGEGLRCETVSPWVLGGALAGWREALAGRVEPAGRCWVYSGNLGRAHEWETLLEAQGLLERRGVDAELCFQGGGASRELARGRAEGMGLRRCAWRGYEEEGRLAAGLMRAGALVATQREEVLGLLWPSKLALLRALPRPLLWVGPPGGAIAAELRCAPGCGVFAPGDAAGVAAWVEGALAGRVAPPEALDAGAERERALAQFAALLEKAAGSPGDAR